MAVPVGRRCPPTRCPPTRCPPTGRDGRRTSGFTLVEVTVVLAVLALLMLALPPMLRRTPATTSLRAAGREVAAMLTEARARALATQGPVAIMLDLETRQMTLREDRHEDRHGAPDDAGGTTPGEPLRRPLPDRAEIALYTAASELVDGTRGAIRFFPDGSSTGGRITLSEGTVVVRVTVHWLTGAVTVE